MAALLGKISSKLPPRREILPVFSLVLFIVFSWTLYRLFWYVPSWIQYLTIWEVFILGAYALGFALLEGVFVLFLALLLALIFPAKRFRDQFIAQGSTFVLLIGAGAVALQRKMGILYSLSLREIFFYPILFLALVVFILLVTSYLYDRFRTVPALIGSVAERMTVFAYIYIPLGLLGLIIVTLRNIS